MSSKPFSFFVAPKKAIRPGKIYSCPCVPLLAAGIERSFIRELPEQRLRINVRPFHPEKDIPVVRKWMRQEYAGALVAGQAHSPELEEYYACMIESDFIQPFMGLVNEMPLCQIDIFRMQQDVLSLNYPAQPGDFGIQLIMAPLSVQDDMILLIKCSLEYFFSFAEVGRIIVNIEDRDEYNRRLFKKAGFRKLHRIQTHYRASSLYGFTASVA
jgi:hypothetical protein